MGLEKGQIRKAKPANKCSQREPNPTKNLPKCPKKQQEKQPEMQDCPRKTARRPGKTAKHAGAFFCPGKMQDLQSKTQDFP